MKIVKEGPFNWHNLHETYSQQVTDLYHLANEQAASGLDSYNATTRGIQLIIADSIASGIPLRALGGNWSLSPITATPGIILNTKPLNAIFPITSHSTHADYTGEDGSLFLAQCGNGIWELNDFLTTYHRSLPASGASNGQTIAGAIATGTHGAGISFGATQDAVVGLHIITGPSTHIWLERASAPVVTDAFIELLGATPVRDDEAFNAALVSVGAFGFIHGIMIQTEPEYLLECYMRHVPINDELKLQLKTLDFNYSQLPYQGVVPFHFGCLINPYDPQHRAYLTVMYKIPYAPGYTPPAPNGAGIGPGDDAPAFMGKLTDLISATVPVLVNNVLAANLTPYEKKIGRLGEIFNNTTLRGKVASAAMGFDPARITEVIDMLIEVNNNSGPFVGVFAFRFVKASAATMAFTHFTPVTCVLELDGVQSNGTMRFYEAVWAQLKALGIPFTFHWGKMNILDAAMVREMYGDSLDSFLSARSRLVEADTLRAFSNDALQRYGLDATSSDPVNAPATLIFETLVATV
jgi:hypothetical protein